MSMALELEVREQRKTIETLRDRLDAFEVRCDELDRKLAQKLSEAVDETMAEAPIRVPAIPQALRDLGLGKKRIEKEA